MNDVATPSEAQLHKILATINRLIENSEEAMLKLLQLQAWAEQEMAKLKVAKRKAKP